MKRIELQDFELNEKIKSLARQERELTQEILEHVAEVDRRKLYLAMSYPSLFEYLVREIGYSEGSAQRRIDAARLLQRIPEISNHIHSGSISLSQISKMQKICRQIKRTSGDAIQVSVQKEVLEKLQNQGAKQTDLILAREFQIEIAVEEKKQIQSDESVRVEVTFSKEEMQVIGKAQAILSHKTGGNIKATLLEMANQIIKAQVPKNRPAATVAVQTTTPRLRKEILHRDRSCQYKDHKSGRICGSKYFLEVDHVQPRYVGGTNTAKNLRTLCSAHNKF